MLDKKLNPKKRTFNSIRNEETPLLLQKAKDFLGNKKLKSIPTVSHRSGTHFTDQFILELTKVSIFLYCQNFSFFFQPLALW